MSKHRKSGRVPINSKLKFLRQLELDKNKKPVKPKAKMFENIKELKKYYKI